jgi:NAD(P)-dependent dehydrogenase (short-subunit alcohol dehydrogenase family)
MGGAGAALLAAESGRVVIADADREKGQRVSQLILDAGGEVVYIPVDICGSESVQEMVRWSTQQLLVSTAWTFSNTAPLTCGS